MEKTVTLTEKDFIAASATATSKYLDDLQEAAKEKGRDVDPTSFLAGMLSCAAFSGILGQVLFPKETEAEKEAKSDNLKPANAEA